MPKNTLFSIFSIYPSGEKSLTEELYIQSNPDSFSFSAM